MVASELLDLIDKYQLTKYVGVEDFADKLSFLYSVVILIVMTVVITAKSYVLKPLTCYIPTTPNGKNFDGFTKNYCWVHGTIPIRNGQHIPQNDTVWDMYDETKRINYYQWIPFVLGLQCILFYLPRVIWQLVCYNRLGADLDSIIKSAEEAVHAENDEDKDQKIDYAARTLESVIFQNRDIRTGHIAQFRRRVHRICSLCVVSKKLGTWLVSSYMMIKLLYLANAVGQLCMMRSFLGFDDSVLFFGPDLAKKLSSGIEWEDSLYFPRLSFCVVNVRHLGVNKNKYVASCVLPVNMLNEKVYIFLWFWTAFVALMTALSIPVWFIRMALLKNQESFVKKFLRAADHIDASKNDGTLHKFIRQFLRQDGVFLLRMLSLNAGDLITGKIMCNLWDSYTANYIDRDLRCDLVDRTVKKGPDDFSLPVKRVSVYVEPNKYA